MTSCILHTVVLVPGSSQHHQLVGGGAGGVAGATFVGESGWVEVSALVSWCIGLWAGKFQIGEYPAYL